jgi:hypothetical protein
MSDMSLKSDLSLKSTLSASNSSINTAGTAESFKHADSTASMEMSATVAAAAVAQGGSTATVGSKESKISRSYTAASTDLDTAVCDQDATKPAQVAAPTADGAFSGPELVGFVLLDPLCEAGEETGYVVSIQRMKSSAHAGEFG